MSYAIRYRCRRCELCYDDSVGRSAHDARQICALRSTATPLVVHDCADGSFGVADLVGVVKLQEEAKEAQPQ